MSDQRFLVAARKYRPQRFDEVVAQEHVCDTLKNAIERDRVGHAYLFSGPRGVGKTTVARILAKSMNCTTPLEQRDGAEPCQHCDSCRSFAEGRSLNVIEIDAASNNKVEDVRELRDTVRVPPQGGKKKVYIVDEIHMLSTSAFNALLKTLEEPPPYALFIFATTEPNKVLPTILSRCQRFDFRRIPVSETVDRLKEIAAEEGITIDEASLLLIAQKGDGALRDSLSVFDQAVALCGAEVTYDALAEALGVVDIDLFFEATEHVRKGNAAGMLDLVQRVVSAGFDLQEFLTGLSEHLRNLFVARTMPDTRLIEASAAVKDRYGADSRNFTEAAIMRLLAVAAETESGIRASAQPRLQVELGLLKMVHAANTLDLRRLLDRLDQLESLTSSDPTTMAAPANSGGGSEARGDEVVASEQQKTQPARDVEPSKKKRALEKALASQEANSSREKSEPETKVVRKAAGSGASHEGTSADSADRATTDSVDSNEADGVARKRKKKDGGVPAAAPTVESLEEAAGAEVREEATVPDLFGPPALSKRSRKNGGASGMMEGSAARSVATDVDMESGGDNPDTTASSTQNWLPFVKAVKGERIHVGSLLQHTAPSAVSRSELVIDVPDDFHRRLLENQRDFLLQHARLVIAESLSMIRFVVRTTVQPFGGETAEDFDPYDYMQRKRQSNPVIRAIFDEFGGELVW